MLKSSTPYRLVLVSSIGLTLVSACAAPSAERPVESVATSTVAIIRPAPQQAAPVAVAPADTNEFTAVDLRLPDAAQQTVEHARADLAQRLGMSPESIEILSAQQRVVSRPGSNVGGWLIHMIAADQRYQYQVLADGTLRFVQ